MPPSNTEAALGLPWLRLSSELGWGCLRTAIPIPPAAERLPEESGQNTSSILIQGEGEGKRESFCLRRVRRQGGETGAAHSATKAASLMHYETDK